MTHLTTGSVMKTEQSKPVLKRSASFDFATNATHERQSVLKKTNMRYTPYSVVTRSFLRSRSNSQHISGADKYCVLGFKHGKRAPKMKKSLNSPENRRSRPTGCDVNPGISDFVYGDSTLCDKLIKENNLENEKTFPMLDMTLRLQDTLVICDPENSTHPTTIDDSTANLHAFDSNYENQIQNKEKQIIPNDCDTCSDSFIPTFGDEFCFTSSSCYQDSSAKEEDISFQERRQEPTYQKLFKNEYNFLDNETVSQVLRKADTILFDDKENESDFDFDFSVPLLATQPSCEGDRAKRSWAQPLHGYCCHEIQNDNDPLGNRDDQGADLNDTMSYDWLKANPFSMLTQTLTNHNALSQIQGAYTCSICSTNLEVDPFKSLQRNGLFSLSSFTATPRSHDCDITLYCPACCYDRMVFHANRLV